MKACPLIPADWDLPAVLRIRLGHGPGRQRVIEADGHLLLVLHEIPKPHQQERVGLLFWRDPEGDWHSTVPGAGPDGITEHLQNYEKTINRLTEKVEAATTSQTSFKLLSRLSPVSRAMRNMYSTLQDARKLCKSDPSLLNWRDQAYDLSRRVELLQSDAQTTLDFEIARQAEIQAEASHQMATSAHRLNVLAAFFFPLATFAAVLGADVQHVLPELSAKSALLLMLIIGVLLGAGLTYLITRPVKQQGEKKDEQ